MTNAPLEKDPHERIYGIKCIAAALGRSERYVRRMSSSKMLLRLPLRRSHLGIYISRWRLENWVHEHDEAYASDLGSSSQEMSAAVQPREKRRSA